MNFPFDHSNVIPLPTAQARPCLTHKKSMPEWLRQQIITELQDQNKEARITIDEMVRIADITQDQIARNNEIILMLGGTPQEEDPVPMFDVDYWGGDGAA